MNIFVHAWSEDDPIPEISVERNHPSLSGPEMPRDVRKERSKRYVLRKMSEPNWHQVTSPNAVVRGDLQKEDLKGVAALSEELQVMLRSYLGGPHEKAKYSTRIFMQHQDFKRAAAISGASTAEAFYNPASTEIVMNFSTYPEELFFQRSFAHEFTHAYVDRTFHRTEPIWLMEGVAEWFSNIQWRAGVLVPGQLPPQRTMLLLSMNNQASYGRIGLKDLLSASRDELYSVRFSTYYSLSWSVVDYLMSIGELVRTLQSPSSFSARDHEKACGAHLEAILA